MRVRLVVDVDILDQDVLLAYAKKRTDAMRWGDILDGLEGDELVIGALTEALLISNENPSPDEYGIEFVRHEGSVISQ